MTSTAKRSASSSTTSWGRSRIGDISVDGSIYGVKDLRKVNYAMRVIAYSLQGDWGDRNGGVDTKIPEGAVS